eukprot:936184_1
MRELLADNQHEYSDKQIDSLVAVNIFGATLSLIGALFIITNYCLFSSLRKNFAFKLILMIGISDLILAISNLMGAPDWGSTCYFQAILQQIGDISGILWVATVSWTINKLTQVTKLPTKQELNKLYRNMHIIIWIITLILTILPFTTKSYGVAGGWCWIKGYENVDIMWRYLCFYVPLWMAIIYMIIIYIKVWKRLHAIDDIDITENDGDTDDDIEINNNNIMDSCETNAMTSSGDQYSSADMESKLKRKKNNTLQRMKFYPLILIICYTFATIRRIIDWATEDQTPYFLAILHTFFAAIPGFLNAIVYGLTKDVRTKDKQAIQEYCGCCSKKDNGSTS